LLIYEQPSTLQSKATTTATKHNNETIIISTTNMNGPGTTVPTIEGPNKAPASVKIEKNEGIGASIARKSTRLFQLMAGADHEMMGCCEDAEALIDKCRKTKDPKTCQEAFKEMALCMHYQHESYDW
jgi:hypothetical protein